MYVDLLSHRPRRRGRAANAVWAKHIVRHWDRNKPAVVAVLAGTVIVLAMIGFSETKPSRPPLDSLYESLQLFALDGNAGQNANVYVQIARYLGPLVLGYAAVGAVLAMYGEQFNRFVVRRLRRHVVIAGLGAAGYRLANAFAADGWPVVAIDSDAANVSIAGCRERGIRVLVGDATDAKMLRQAGVDKAELLVALCGRDQVNIDVAAAARSVSAGDRSQVLTALAGFDDFHLWQVMKAPALVDQDESGFRLELVNLWAVAAELLLDEHPPFPRQNPGSPHVVVVSDEGLADSLLIGILRRWMAAPRQASDFLRLTLVGAPPEVLDDLAVRNPELEEISSCRLELWARTAGNGGGASAPADASAVYVALASETAALTTALTLRHQMGHWEETPIVVVVEDDEAGVAHAVKRGGPAMKGIHAFGWLSRTLLPAPLLESTATEVIARLGHLLHCQHQNELGLTERDDPSLVAWEQLPGSLPRVQPAVGRRHRRQAGGPALRGGACSPSRPREVELRVHRGGGGQSGAVRARTVVSGHEADGVPGRTARFPASPAHRPTLRAATRGEQGKGPGPRPDHPAGPGPSRVPGQAPGRGPPGNLEGPQVVGTSPEPRSSRGRSSEK